MAPLDSPVKDLDEKYINSTAKFVSEVRNGKPLGSNDIASRTVALLEQIIADSQNATAFELVGLVREVGRRLLRALPHELVCGNIVRRVLRAIRDEHRAYASQQSGSGAGGGESLQRLVQAAPARRATIGAAHDLIEPLRDHIAELRLELESSTSAICGTAREHIHSDELILTCGSSALVERFLTAACSARRYRLLVAETADSTHELSICGTAREHIHSDELILTCGSSALVERFLTAACSARRYRLLVAETADSTHETHAMAARLSAAGVAVTVISNASVYAVMSRVNKVVMSATAALAGGGVLAGAGGASVALAAKHHSVPVIALAPLHKLCPLHACDPRHFNSLVAPNVKYEGAGLDLVHVFAPRYDLVPPDHVTLFITNLGGSSPSYIYRLMSELYDPLDYQL